MPCDIMILMYTPYLSYCNSYSKQSVLTLHVLYCKIYLYCGEVNLDESCRLISPMATFVLILDEFF